MYIRCRFEAVVVWKNVILILLYHVFMCIEIDAHALKIYITWRGRELFIAINIIDVCPAKYGTCPCKYRFDATICQCREIICPETWNSIFDHMTMCAFQNIQQDIFCSKIKFIVANELIGLISVWKNIWVSQRQSFLLKAELTAR